MATKKKYEYLLIRVCSSRGTDFSDCVKIPTGQSAASIRNFTEDWAGRRTRDTACREYTVSYRKVRVPKRPILLKRYDRACQAYYKAKQRQVELAAMLNSSANSYFD